MTSKNKTILIVDDDSNMAGLVERVCAGLGFQTEYTDSGEAALNHLHGAQYAAVLSDVHMPVMGGFELLQNIHRRYPGVPVILMSGLCEPHARQAALAWGAKALLEKPIQKTQLAGLLTAPRREVNGRQSVRS